MSCPAVGRHADPSRGLRLPRAPLQRVDALAGVRRRVAHVHHAAAAPRARRARGELELGVDLVHGDVARAESVGRRQVRFLLLRNVVCFIGVVDYVCGAVCVCYAM